MSQIHICRGEGRFARTHRLLQRFLNVDGKRLHRKERSCLFERCFKSALRYASRIRYAMEIQIVTSTSSSKRYSARPSSNSTSRSVRPRFSVTETRVPSLGKSIPVFAERIVFVRFNFRPVFISHLGVFLSSFPHS